MDSILEGLIANLDIPFGPWYHDLALSLLKIGKILAKKLAGFSLFIYNAKVC